MTSVVIGRRSSAVPRPSSVVEGMRIDGYGWIWMDMDMDMDGYGWIWIWMNMDKNGYGYG